MLAQAAADSGQFTTGTHTLGTQLCIAYVYGPDGQTAAACLCAQLPSVALLGECIQGCQQQLRGVDLSAAAEVTDMFAAVGSDSGYTMVT